MAFEINEFAGFSSGGPHDIAAASAGVSYVTTPAAPGGNGGYSIQLGNTGTQQTCQSNSFAVDDGSQITSFLHRFTDTTDIQGGEDRFMECRDLASGLANWYCAWADGGSIKVCESDGTLITVLSPILKDTWYRIDVRWTLGNSESMSVWYTPAGEVWDSFSTIYSGTFNNLDLKIGADTEAFLHFSCPFDAITANDMHVKGWYNGKDSASDSDILGNFEVRTFVTDDAATDYDDGDGNTEPDENWNEGANIPFSGTFELFDGDGSWAAKATHLSDALYGPNDDAAVTGDIRACKWIVDGRRYQKYLIWGKWDGSAATYTVDTALFTGGNIAIVADRSHVNCPRGDEYPLIGIESNDAINTVSIVSMCCSLLHVPAKRISLGTHHRTTKLIIAG